MIFIFLLANWARATPTLEHVYVRRLILAHHQAEIERTQITFRRWQVLRLACERQLAQNEVPISCYGRIKLERAWGLPSPENQISELNERCRRAARALRLPAPMADLAALSKACHGEIVTSQKIQAYRRGEVRVWSAD